MILSDEEIIAAGYKSGDPDGLLQFGRNLEAAILAKLASAELPEPATVTVLKEIPYYTADQLCEAYAQGAAAQLAEKPSAWKWKVNRCHQHLAAYPPPNDAYDEGTLVELYTRRQA